jgi:tRNA C32,U32 (ribose-2'-O)-methylase TrmJ
VTAVHAQEILKTARFSQDLTGAIHDLDVIFASTAKPRKNFSVLPMEEAIKQIFGFPSSTKIGLLFGNERTGLTSEDLLQSNFRFKIPQAGRQPSYNLASAVLITLFSIFSVQASDEPDVLTQPISRDEQEVCVQRILINLEKKGFIHKTNKKHMEEMVWDLFGRLTMTAEDRSLLLALFSKGTLKKM